MQKINVTEELSKIESAKNKYNNMLIEAFEDNSIVVDLRTLGISNHEACSMVFIVKTKGLTTYMMSKHCIAIKRKLKPQIYNLLLDELRRI